MWSLSAQVAALVVLAVQTVLQLRRLRNTEEHLQRAEKEAKFEAEERRAERAGRVKAEKELRKLQLRLGQLEAGAAAAAAAGADGSSTDGGATAGSSQPVGGTPDLQQVAFPLRPIGLLRSCFSRRNGTPRQPLLVPAARARLTLRPGLSEEFFEGLQQYSHCWVVYVFHENTDLQRLWQDKRDSGVRAKIRVPRLDGGKLGVFATRSPHRPCPIGLSVAQVVAVEGRTLVLGGADIVDGTPVLDIKPYIFCDSVPAATAPAWVAAKAEDEPLHIGGLRMPAAADAALKECWEALGPRSLYRSFEQYKELVVQVLSRDIRSVTQRIKVPHRTQHGGPAALCSTSSSHGAAPAEPTEEQQQQALSSGAAADPGSPVVGQLGQQQEGFWKVVLDGISISYDVEDGSSDVVLRTARLASSADE